MKASVKKKPAKKTVPNRPSGKRSSLARPMKQLLDSVSDAVSLHMKSPRFGSLKHLHAVAVAALDEALLEGSIAESEPELPAPWLGETSRAYTRPVGE